MGKRSGEGFVAHKSKLVNALARTLADRVLVMDTYLGRKGFLGYIKALGGSNFVKIVPASSNGNASEPQVADKRLKVVCGRITGYLDDKAWIGEKTPLSLAELRVSPDNRVECNVGNTELADALNKVLPFTAKGDDRPVLQCVLFRASDGKLTLIGCDGFRLGMVSMDYDGEGEVLINRDELKGIANALRKAKRVRIGIEKDGESLDGMSLVIDTEAINYRWQGDNGNYPNYEKIIPTEFNSVAHLDTIEAIKAVLSFRALSENPKTYPIDLTIGDGEILMTNPDDKGEALVSADTDGQGNIRVDGKYLADVLKACGGALVDMKLVNASSPLLFSTDGTQFVVMPMSKLETKPAIPKKRKTKKAKDQQTIELEQPEADIEPALTD